MDLIPLFEKLGKPDSEDQLAAAPVTPGSPHRVARDTDGKPSILIRTTDRAKAPGHRLLHIEATHARECHLRRADGSSEQGTFTSILCTAPDESVQHLFLSSVSPVLDLLPDAAQVSAIDHALGNLFELFRQLMSPARESTLGVWGELLTIDASLDPEAMIRAWHEANEDVVDFASNDEWLEVKTTQGAVRAHEVSRRQLEPPVGIAGTLVSIMTVPNSEGVSIRDLMDSLEQRVTDSSLVEKMRSLVVAALGETWVREVDRAFDQSLGRQTMRLYSMASLPSIAAEIPPEISAVRYRLDLQGLPVAGTKLRGPLSSTLESHPDT